MGRRWWTPGVIYLLLIAETLLLHEGLGDEAYEVLGSELFGGIPQYADYPLFFSMEDQGESEETGEQEEHVELNPETKRDLIKGPSFSPIIDGTEPDVADEFTNNPVEEEKVTSEIKELIPKKVQTVNGRRMSEISRHRDKVGKELGKSGNQLTSSIVDNSVKTAGEDESGNEANFEKHTNKRGYPNSKEKSSEDTADDKHDRSKAFAYKERQALSEDLIKLLFNWERHKVETRDGSGSGGASEEEDSLSKISASNKSVPVKKSDVKSVAYSDQDALKLLSNDEKSVEQTKPTTVESTAKDDKADNAVSREFHKSKGKINVLVNVNINERPFTRSLVLGSKSNPIFKESGAIDTNGQVRSYLAASCNQPPCLAPCGVRCVVAPMVASAPVVAAPVVPIIAATPIAASPYTPSSSNDMLPSAASQSRTTDSQSTVNNPAISEAVTSAATVANSNYTSNYVRLPENKADKDENTGEDYQESSASEEQEEYEAKHKNKKKKKGAVLVKQSTKGGKLTAHNATAYRTTKKHTRHTGHKLKYPSMSSSDYEEASGEDNINDKETHEQQSPAPVGLVGKVRTETITQVESPGFTFPNVTQVMPADLQPSSLGTNGNVPYLVSSKQPASGSFTMPESSTPGNNAPKEAYSTSASNNFPNQANNTTKTVSSSNSSTTKVHAVPTEELDDGGSGTESSGLGLSISNATASFIEKQVKEAIFPQMPNQYGQQSAQPSQVNKDQLQESADVSTKSVAPTSSAQDNRENGSAAAQNTEPIPPSNNSFQGPNLWGYNQLQTLAMQSNLAQANQPTENQNQPIKPNAQQNQQYHQTQVQQPTKPSPTNGEQPEQIRFGQQNVPSPNTTYTTPVSDAADSGKEKLSLPQAEYENEENKTTKADGANKQLTHPTQELKQKAENETVPKLKNKTQKHHHSQQQATQGGSHSLSVNEGEKFVLPFTNKSTNQSPEQPSYINIEGDQARQPPPQATKAVVHPETSDRPQESETNKGKAPQEGEIPKLKQSQEAEIPRAKQAQEGQEPEAVSQSPPPQNNANEINLDEQKGRTNKDNQVSEIQFAGTKSHKTPSEPIVIDQVKDKGGEPKLNPKDATVFKNMRIHTKGEPELGEEVMIDKEPKAQGIETPVNAETSASNNNPLTTVQQETEDEGSGNESKYGTLESVRAKFKAWEKQMLEKLSRSVLKGSKILTPKETYDEVTAQVNKTAFQSWKEEEKNLLSRFGFPVLDAQSQHIYSRDNQTPIQSQLPMASHQVLPKNASVAIDLEKEHESEDASSIKVAPTVNVTQPTIKKEEPKKVETKKISTNKTETKKVAKKQDSSKIDQLEKFKEQILGEVEKINNLQEQYKKVYQKSPELDRAKGVLEKDLKAIKDIEKKVSYDLQITESGALSNEKNRAKDTLKALEEQTEESESSATSSSTDAESSSTKARDAKEAHLEIQEEREEEEKEVEAAAASKNKEKPKTSSSVSKESISSHSIHGGNDEKINQFIKMIDASQKRSRNRHPLERIQGLLQAEIERVKETEKSKTKGKDIQLEYIRRLLKNELMQLLASGQYKSRSKSLDPNLKKLQKLIHNRVKKARKNRKKSQRKKKHKMHKGHRVKAVAFANSAMKQPKLSNKNLDENKPSIPNQAVLSKHISNALQNDSSQFGNPQTLQTQPPSLENSGAPNKTFPAPAPAAAQPTQGQASSAPSPPSPPPPPAPPPSPPPPSPPPSASNPQNPGSALNSGGAPEKLAPGTLPAGQPETASQTERFKSLLENLKKNIGEVYNRLQTQNRLNPNEGVVMINPNDQANNNNNDNNNNQSPTQEQNQPSPPASPSVPSSTNSLNVPSTPSAPNAPSAPSTPSAPAVQNANYNPQNVNQQQVQPVQAPQPSAEEAHLAAQSKHEMPPPVDEDEDKEEPPEPDTVLSENEPVQTLIENLERDITDVWSYRDLYPDANSIGLDNEKIHRTYANLGSLSGLNLRRALDRAMRGKDVGLAIVGGSISKGGPFSEKGVEYVLRAYFYAIADWWNKIIRPVTGSSMIIRDVSIGGIATDYFSYCLRTHLPNDKLTNIVLWELSANDMRRFDDGIKPKGQALEQFTRNVLAYKAKPALIYVNFFALFEWDEDLFTHCRNFEDEGENDVAKYYKITSLSWRNMVCPLLKTKTPLFTRDELFAEDHFHPSIEGHAQMAYILTDYIRTEFLKNLVKMRLLTIGQAVKRMTIPKTVYVPRSMFAETFRWRPLCYTYMLVDNRSPNNSLPLTTENTGDFRYKIVRQFKVRSDKIAGMETNKGDQYITYKIRVPMHTRSDRSGYKRLAIMSFTDDRQAEVRYDRGAVHQIDTGKRFLEGTVVKYVAENVTPGDHELTIRSSTGGFLVCAILLG